MIKINNLVPGFLWNVCSEAGEIGRIEKKRNGAYEAFGNDQTQWNKRIPTKKTDCKTSYAVFGPSLGCFEFREDAINAVKKGTP